MKLAESQITGERAVAYYGSNLSPELGMSCLNSLRGVAGRVKTGGNTHSNPNVVSSARSSPSGFCVPFKCRGK